MNNDTFLVRDFTLDDLKKVDPGNTFIDKASMINGHESVMLTFEHEGQAVACAGLVQLWPGVAEAWTALGDFARSRPVKFCRTLKMVLAENIEAMDLRRVQMHVEDTVELTRWARFMGFTREGTLKNYTPEGKTLHVYAFFP